MKNTLLSILSFLSVVTIATAQSTTPGDVGQGVLKCTIDSFKTNSLNISTGIGLKIGSDSVLMACGYGGNSYYTTPNNNVDTLWTVGRFAANYNPRPTGPFTYTAPYLVPGGHPYIICALGNPVGGFYDAFESGGNCLKPTGGTVMASNWVSVYADAGGQTGAIKNAVGDGYRFDRCFYICNEDTLMFNMDLLADDIVDTVKVDNVILYVASVPTAQSNFTCAKKVSINKSVALGAGRHTLMVWTRDNAGGHIALNIYGHIESAGGKNNIVRSKYDSRCTFNPVAINESHKSALDFSISPNPSKGSLSISLAGNNVQYTMQVFDMSSKLVTEKELKSGNHQLNLNVAAGVYFIRLSSQNQVAVQKLIIE